MLLWLGFAVLSAVVLIALLNPLLRAAPAAVTDHGDSGRELAIYRDQLAEVEAERERGQIGAAEAEAARAEIARRLLAAEDKSRFVQSSSLSLAPAGMRRLAIGLMIGLPVAAMGLYLVLGSPHLPAQPLAARMQQPVDPRGDVGQLVAAVERRLKQYPEDGQGWDVIAPVYLRLGRYPEAAEAFQRAIRLLGEDAKRLAGLAESTVLASDGIVNDTARVAYEKLLKLEPQRPEPRFWLALAKEQNGQLVAALADYRALLRDGDPKASWRTLVEERVAGVVDEIAKSGAPPAAAKPKPPKAPETPMARGPGADDVKAAEKMSETDRQRMIEGMVQGLAERLAKDGRDLAGWQRLIRAYSVMGRKQDALSALAKARGHFAGEPPSLIALADLARSLGLES